MALVLAGCIQPVDEATGKPRDFCTDPAPGIPLICFAVDLQAQQLVVLGLECCEAHWENITVAVSGDSKCRVETPGSGVIQTNQRVTVLGGAVDCSLKVAYNGVSLGVWEVGPTAQLEAKEAATRVWEPTDAEAEADAK